MNPVTTIKLKFPRSSLPNSGLVLDYSFDDGTATDLSGNDNDGAITGTTTVNGEAGKAFEFDGVDDEVDAGAVADLFADTGEAWTLSINADVDGGRIFDNGNVAIRRIAGDRYDIALRGRSNPVYVVGLSGFVRWLVRWDGSAASARVNGTNLIDRTTTELYDDGGTQILDDSGTAIDPSYEWLGR